MGFILPAPPPRRQMPSRVSLNKMMTKEKLLKTENYKKNFSSMKKLGNKYAQISTQLLYLLYSCCILNHNGWLLSKIFIIEPSVVFVIKSFLFAHLFYLILIGLLIFVHNVKVKFLFVLFYSC